MNITNKMACSRAELRKLYPGADLEIFYRDPVSDREMWERFMTNKLWRLNNMYTIVDKHGVRRRFIMNYAQLVVFSKSLEHARILILKSRQQGISTFWLISFFDDTLFVEDLLSGLMSQGKAESGTLLKRIKLAWHNVPEVVIDLLRQKLTKDNSDEIGFANGSTIFIRTSFRSATLQRLHISEYGKICNRYPEKAKETKTGTLQAIAPGNTVVIESTAEGVNDFKYMWDKGEGKLASDLGPKEFLCVFLSWLQDPDCNSSVHRVPTTEQAAYFEKIEVETGTTISDTQKNFWIDQYEELGEYIFQEYPATPDEAFKAVRDGSYYDEKYKKLIVRRGRCIPKLYDHNLPVEVAADLGMNDDFVLGYFQTWGGDKRVIEEYRHNGEDIEHYTAHMKATGYDITTVYLPHDAEVRELNTGQSRVDRFRELMPSVNFVVLPRIPITTGIELVRSMLAHFWIDERCVYLQTCLQNYSKEWDEKLQVWKDKPLHNEFSHGADMLRYMAMSKSSGDESKTKSKRKPSRQVVDGLAI